MKRFEILLNDKAYLVEVTNISGDSALVIVNGTEYEVGINDLTLAAARKEMPKAMQVTAAPPAAAPAPKAEAKVETVGGLTTIQAPLPGLIIEVKVQAGDAVKTGDVVLVIETMKMENNVVSPRDGTIKEVNVSASETVKEGQPLIVIGD